MSADAEESLRDWYARLVREHGAAISRVASSYEAARAARQDLEQEIALAVWQALPRFRRECSERTFVLRIAHNQGLSHAWRRRRRGDVAEPTAAEAMPDPRPDAEELAARAQRGERLAEALRRLPVGLRQVLTLTLEGLTNAEAGEVLGLSENNVAVRLSRARQELRRILGGEG